jgi:hypothetical protein
MAMDQTLSTFADILFILEFMQAASQEMFVAC